MSVNWEEFTPVNHQPNSSVNWDEFTPVDAKKRRRPEDGPAPERTVGDVLKDAGVTALKGAVGLPQAFAGLADIVTLGRAGKALEELGYRPEETQQILESWYSPAQQAANRNVSEAEGFFGKIDAAIENPSVIAKTIGESIPQMLGGAAIARGLIGATAGKVAPWVAGGIGEGVIGAGSAASQIRSETEDGLLTPKQAGAAVASGAGTAVLGAAGGKIAQRMGVPDVDTMLASGKLAKSPAGFVKAVVGAGISEGVFEELPQSVQEQMWQNWALDKPLMEGVDQAAALGMLSGMAMGGIGGGYNAAMARREDPAADPVTDATPPTPGDAQAAAATPASPAAAPAAMAPAAAPADVVGTADTTEAERKLREPVTLTALDRVNEIDGELARIQSRQQELTPENGYGPTFDQERQDLAARAQELAQEREALAASWPKALPGMPTSFSTEAGVRLQGRYALMDADELVTSHDENLRSNPLYPQELQPRDRSRAASELQVSGIVQKLDPARLGVSADAATGAPIVGADGLVESGNARTIALKRVYQANGQKAEDYKQFLRDNAQQFGLDPAAIDQVRKPVLVRLRETPVNRAEFARQANASTVQRMAPAEQALSDAKRLASLEGLEPDDNGEFNTSYDFIRQFMAMLPTTEQSDMLESDGRLSTYGYRRIQNAILAKAYGDSPTLRRMTESMDDNLRNISKALVRVAPTIAAARERMDAGTLYDADIAPDLVQAVEGLSALKEKGWTVRDELNQNDLTGPKYSPEAAQLLTFLSENARSPRRIAEFIQRYYEALEQAGDPSQPSMFGETSAPTRADLLNTARGTPDDTAQDAQRRNDREGAAPAAQDGRQPENATGDRGGDQGDGPATADAGETRLSRGPQSQAADPRAEAVAQFKDALADLAEIATRHTKAYMVDPGKIPDLMPTLVKLFSAAIKIVGTDLKAATKWVKDRMKADPRLKTFWNKIGNDTYQKAALQALESMEQPAQAGLFDSLEAATEAVQGDLFSAPAQKAETVIIDGQEYDLDAPNFGMPEAPITLQKGHPLLVETAKKALDSEVTFDGRTMTRAEMHQIIIGWHFQRAQPAPLDRKPIAYVMGGGGASGKGTVKKALRQQGLIRDDGAVNLDPDEIKLEIPEYQQIVAAGDSRAAAMVHEESSDLAKKIKARAIEGRYDMVLDVTLGDQAKGIKYLQELKDAGYEVRLIGVTTDPQTSVIRAIKRAQASGRWVPINHLLQAHKGFNAAFPKYAEVADAAYLYENTDGLKNVAEKQPGGDLVPGNGYNVIAERSVLNEQARTLREIGQRPAARSGQAERGGSAGSQAQAGRDNGGADGPIQVGKPGSGRARSAGESDRGLFLDDEGGVASGAQQGGVNANRRTGQSGDQGQEPGAVPATDRQGATQRVRHGSRGPNQRAGGDADTGAADQPEVGQAWADGVRGPDADGQQPQPRGRARADAGVPAGRDIPAKSGRNYRFGPDDLTYEGSWLKKAEQNVEAVELLKALEKEGRQATPDEQKILAKFIGWGSSEIANSLFGDKIAKKKDAITAYQKARALIAEGKSSIDRYHSDYWTVLQPMLRAGARYGMPINLSDVTLTALGLESSDLKYAALRDRLKASMSEQEWAEASRSTQYAHYTSKAVVQSMWRALDRMGFKGGAILEPGAGIGVFPGLMPEAMAHNSIYTGVEFDSITGGILKQLFPDERILVESFVDSKLPKNFYDVAVGNPPFSGTKILSDPEYAKRAFSLHDYFFAKSIDRVKPGGLVVYVTSRYTMDKLDDKARAYLAERADLVGAIRLPQTAFKQNAGTEVVTDVIFLRKKVPGETFDGAQSWSKSVPIEVNGSKYNINEYFVANPQMVLGRHSDAGSMYADKEYTVEPIEGDIESLFDKAVERLPANIYQAPRGSAAEAAKVREIDFNPKAQKEGNYYVTDAGVLMVREGGVGQRVQLKNQKDIELIKDFVPLRDALKQAHYDQLNDGDWETSLKALQDAYAKFTKKHGQINQFTTKVVKTKAVDEDTGETYTDETLVRVYPLLKKLEDDPDYTLVAALETIDEDTGEIKPSAFLTERVLGKPEDARISGPVDALLSSLNDVGKVDIDLIAQRAGLSPAEAIEALGSAIYEDPEVGWVTADEYLSGNVKRKLDLAREAVKADKRFERNVQALEAAQPAPKTPSQINVGIGMNWIPGDVYERFLLDLAGVKATVQFNDKTRQWIVQEIAGGSTMAATADWGTTERNITELLEHALTGRPIRITKTVGSGQDRKTVFDAAATEAANQKLDALKERFAGWVWEDAERTDRLVKIYNDTFNTTVPRSFDGRHLTLPGTSKAFSVFDHVKRGAWRIIQKGNTYLAHAVGSGKAQPLDAKVLTPEGWRLMGDIRPGDMVISVDGSPTMVEAVFPQGEKEIFRVEFSDGSATECCEEHLWLTQTYRERSAGQRAARLGKNWPSGRGKVRSLREIADTLVAPHLGAKNHSIPLVGAVQFAAKPLPLDPYVVGALLGDGSMTGNSVMLSSADQQIVDQVAARLPDGCEVVYRSGYDYAIAWRGEVRYAVGGGMIASNPVINAMRSLGLMGMRSHEKFIPDCYLFNTVEARVALLQGLLDTDGSVEGGGTSVRFSTTSEKLADGVKQLVQSLGGVVLVREKSPAYIYEGVRKVGRKAFDLCLSLPAWIVPFRLVRKASQVVPKSRYAPSRYITAVVPVGRKPAQCIRVAHESHLYVTDDFIVTHNTFQMVISAMEQKRLGLIKKPMVVVPNHMLKQFAHEWQMLYPAARLMVADENNFHTDNRRRFVSRVALSDLDGVIITHSAFKLLDLDPAFKRQMIEEQLDYMRAALEEAEDQEGKGSRKSTRIKQIEKQIENMEQKLEAAMSSVGKDTNVRFDELGVDFLYVDEAHEFRKLDFTTSRQVKGISPQGSARSFDLYMKARYLEQKRPGRSLVMASGTPVTNTLAELFTVQKFMNRQALEDRGIEDFDSWAAMFGRERTVLEPNAAGKYEPVTRFSKFVNVPELTQMFRDFADVLTADHLAALLGDKRPKVEGGGRKIVVTPKTDAYAAYQQELSARVEASRKWKPSKDEPNNPDPIIRIIGDGRLAAIDMRFIDPSLPSDPDSKLNRMIDDVIRVFHDTADMEYRDRAGNVEPNKGATMMVFSDLGFGAGVAENRGFNARAWFEKRLRDAGVPMSQVAFMSDYKKSADKLKLFKDVNAGRVRILIGSSKNMGTGVNAQQRLKALFHLDSPWYPADLEQREGRIIRQGNKNPLVQIYAYAAKGTYDENMWKMLASKQFFIDQALSGDENVRELEDLDSQSQYDLAAAMVAEDPRILQLAGARAEIEKLQRLYQAHEDQRARFKQQYDSARLTLDYNTKRLPEAEKMAGMAQDLSGDKFRAKAHGKTYTERAKWAEALMQAYKDLTAKGESRPVEVGEISGFPIVFGGETVAGQYITSLKLGVPEPVTLVSPQLGEVSPMGMVMRAQNAVTDVARLPGKMRERITEARAQMDALQTRLEAPFPMAGMLADKVKEAADLEAAIATDSKPRTFRVERKDSGLGFDVQATSAQEAIRQAIATNGGAIDEWTATEAADPAPGADTRLSRGPGGGGMDADALDRLVKRIQAKMPNLPKVHVLADPSKAPKALREYINRQGAWNDVEGAYHDGDLYLFASGLSDALRAEHVLAEHEAAHYGLRAVLGDQLKVAMQLVYAQNASVRRAVADLQKRWRLSVAEAVEEVIVDIPTAQLAKLKGWRRVVQMVADWLGQHGFERMSGRLNDWLDGTLTEQQRADLFVADLVRAAREYVAGKQAGRRPRTGTRTESRLSQTLASDIAKQEQWLQAEAKARGYQDIEDLLAKNYPLFEKLAELWRQKNPADTLLSRAPAVDSDAFKRWFGDSKVVDDQGRPLVVYHGTAKDFSQFDPGKAGANFGMDSYGIFFADKPNVSAFSAAAVAGMKNGGGDNIMPVFLSIKNPLVVKAKEVIHHYEGPKIIGGAELFDRVDKDRILREAKAGGHDGIRFEPGRDGDGMWIAFRPEQIKSAIGNNGNFDPTNPDIRLSRGKKTAAERAEEIINQKAGSRAPLDAIARTVTRVTGIERLTGAIYDRAAYLLDRYTPEQIKAGVVSDYGVPQAVLDQRVMLQGRQRVQLRKAGQLIDKLATLTRAESRVAYEWMNMDGSDPKAYLSMMQGLPEESVKVLQEVQKMIDDLSKEAVRLGQLSPEAYEKNKFAYLRRSYAKHILEAAEGEKAKRARVISILGDQYKGRGMTESVPMAQIQKEAPEWWGRKLAKGKADTALKGEKFIRLEYRTHKVMDVQVRRHKNGKLKIIGKTKEVMLDTKTRNILPEMEVKAQDTILRGVVYWPAGATIPAKYAEWDQAGTWEVRDVKGSNAIMWRDYTKEEREMMGEVDEARFAIAKTLHGMIHDVEVGRYLEWLSQRYAKKEGETIPGKVVEASERYKDTFSPGEWVRVPDSKIPGTSVHKYGKLAGQYIPGPIWNDLRQVVNGQFKPFGDTYAKILSAWKTAKTALSPAVHTNNILSNFVMADWHDVGAAHIAKALRIILAASKRDGKGVLGTVGNQLARAGIADSDAAREILARYLDSGGDLGSWVTTEIREDQLEPLLKSLEAELAATAGNSMQAQVGVFSALQHALMLRFPSAWEAFKGSKIGGAVVQEGSSLIDLYQHEDDVFRLAAWLKAKEEGKSDLEAGKAARKSFLDYHINAPWIQAMRNSAWPFISYTYRAVPMLVEIAGKKPHKLFKLMAIAGLVNALGVMLAGGGDDDERKLLPEEKAGSIWGMVPKLIRMPWNDAHGSPVYLDIRRWVPVGDVFDVGAGQAAIPMFPALMPGGPLVIFGEVLFNKSAFTGKPITLETDTTAQAAGKVADHLYKAFMPNLLGVPNTYATEGVVGSMTGRTDAFGRELSTPQAVASAFGIKLGSYPTDVLRRNAIAKAQAQQMEIDRNIAQLRRQRQTGRIDADEYRDAVRAEQEKKRQIQRELQEKLR